MRWKQSVAVATLGLALVAAACGGDNSGSSVATSTGAGSGKTSLTIGETLAPASLDITQQSGAAVPQALLYNVYETLVSIDDSGAYQPLLADYKVSSDGLTYTFTLKDDLTFA